MKSVSGWLSVITFTFMLDKPTNATVIYCHSHLISFGTGFLLLLQLWTALIEGYVADDSHNAFCHYITNDDAVTMVNSPAAPEAPVCSTWRNNKYQSPDISIDRFDEQKFGPTLKTQEKNYYDQQQQQSEGEGEDWDVDLKGERW